MCVSESLRIPRNSAVAGVSKQPGELYERTGVRAKRDPALQDQGYVDKSGVSGIVGSVRRSFVIRTNKRARRRSWFRVPNPGAVLLGLLTPRPSRVTTGAARRIFHFVIRSSNECDASHVSRPTPAPAVQSPPGATWQCVRAARRGWHTAGPLVAWRLAGEDHGRERPRVCERCFRLPRIQAAPRSVPTQLGGGC